MSQENRRDKFKRLSEKRINNLLDKIRILGNLANRSRYEFNSDDINFIFSVLQNELKECKMQFEAALKTEKKYKFQYK